MFTQFIVLNYNTETIKKMKFKVPIAFAGIILVGSLVFTFAIFSGWTTWFSEESPIEFLPDMDHQFKVIPQQQNNFFSDRRSMRDPVEGTVARGVSVYPYGQGDFETAETTIVPPDLARTEFVIARGQNQFNVFCSPCHNFDGKGNAPVTTRGKWEGIPDLTRELTVSLSDTRLYHIMSAGLNLMPSYADKISDVDRWAIVAYLRVLQGMDIVPGTKGTAQLSNNNKTSSLQ